MSTNFSKNIAPAVQTEIRLAKDKEVMGNSADAFKHLENAHVLGQESTRWHVKVHCLMLAWAFRQRDLRESIGQIFRIVGAATKTAIGLVPSGNTGGANSSPFKSLAIQAEHQALIRQAKSKHAKRPD